jgi:hypothetical protein
MKLIEQIQYEDKTLAIILRHEFQKDGIEFLTPSDFSQQLGYMKRKKGHVIKPHVHNVLNRSITHTKEVLFIKSGKVRVDFYSDDKIYFKSTELVKGDVILLAFGGHGIYMIEESEIIEVKQGPFSENMDKTKFEPIDESQVIL